jgi:murein DD-endopeptidase MepM/ murein hydrolase activator NlpD
VTVSPTDPLPRSPAARAGRAARRILALGLLAAGAAGIALAVRGAAPAPVDLVAAQAVLGVEATPVTFATPAPVRLDPTAPPWPVDLTPAYVDQPDPTGSPDARRRRGPISPFLLTGYRWPIAHPRVTDDFGPSPWGSRVVNGQLFHDGIDLATFCGDRVTAAHDGVVIAAGKHYDEQIGWVGDLGPYEARLTAKGLWVSLPTVVVIDDGNDYRSIYAHFSRIVVAVGDTVRAGQLLGYEGATGRATGCHLHYGLFSPLATSTLETEPIAAAHMLLPREVLARVDPLVVLPPR